MKPNAMEPAVAEAVLSAAPRSKKLDGGDALAVIFAWLRAKGYERDRWGNYLKAAEPDVRWHFKERVLNQQYKYAGEWRNKSSRSLIEVANNLIVNAAKALGQPEAEVATAARGRREQRTAAAEKRAAKVAREALQKQARTLAAKALAWKYRAELDRQLRGELPTPSVAEQFRADNAAAVETILAALEAKQPVDDDDGQIATVDQPPLLPLLQDVQYEWDHRQDGVDYTIAVAHHQRGQAAIRIGKSTDADIGIGVDPITHAISWQLHRDQRGDGLATGQLVQREGVRFAKLFLIIAHDKQRGVGTRLMRIWCRLMAGYGVSDWLAEAVGPEGEAFLLALEKRGTIEIDHENSKGAFWLVRCR